tara:strand:- start:224 stop:409 length:186 start_codon:yes stop_codon:yes gene_type:complete
MVQCIGVRAAAACYSDVLNVEVVPLSAALAAARPSERHAAAQTPPQLITALGTTSDRAGSA